MNQYLDYMMFLVTAGIVHSNAALRVPSKLATSTMMNKVHSETSYRSMVWLNLYLLVSVMLAVVAYARVGLRSCLVRLRRRIADNMYQWVEEVV
jgi:hypothetical protein